MGQSRRLTAGGVLALHLALVMGLLRVTSAPPERRQTPPPRSSALVWLRPAPTIEVVRTPRQPLHQPLHQLPRQPAPDRRDLASTRLLQAMPVTTVPLPLSLPITSMPAPEMPSGPEASVGANQAASAPLDLRLPPGDRLSSTSAARARLDQARRDTGLAGLATDLRLSEQVIAGGRRFRQGDGCVELRPSRGSLLDPFNASARPMPQQVSPC